MILYWFTERILNVVRNSWLGGIKTRPAHDKYIFVKMG